MEKEDLNIHCPPLSRFFFLSLIIGYVMISRPIVKPRFSTSGRRERKSIKRRRKDEKCEF